MLNCCACEENAQTDGTQMNILKYRILSNIFKTIYTNKNKNAKFKLNYLFKKLQ